MTVNECFTRTCLVGGECTPPTREAFFDVLTRACHAVARLFPERLSFDSLPTDDGAEIPLPPEGAEILPLRVAAEVFYLEDAALADRCLSLYAAEAEGIRKRRKRERETSIVTNGW